MLSVIIPALNEEATIGHVVRFCFSEKLVDEVIVVDDQSSDNTVLEARKAGALIITSKERGKGISMKEGIVAASNQLLVFLDADIHPYPVSTISNLVQPLINNEYDFVKGDFARNAGRVTELVAKPLLKIFYPELASFHQPLSGMIAGRKSFLKKIEIFGDYGVDIGILIDMFLMHARIKEVNIGYIENKSKPWQMLGKMSGDVARAIIKRATYHNNSLVNLEELGGVNIISNQMESVMKEEMAGLRKLVVFDLDDTLLQGRFLEACAKKFNFESELAQLRQNEHDEAVLAKRIAKLLKGLSVGELISVVADIPLPEDVFSTVEALRRKGNIVGIISNSYQFITDYIKHKIGADFSIGYQLDFFEGKATGEVTIPSYFYYHLASKCSHTMCKTNVLLHIAHKFSISIENCVVVTAHESDLCLLEQAGMGIAFCTESNLLKSRADKIIFHNTVWPLMDLESMPSLKNMNLQFS